MDEGKHLEMMCECSVLLYVHFYIRSINMHALYQKAHAPESGVRASSRLARTSAEQQIICDDVRAYVPMAVCCDLLRSSTIYIGATNFVYNCISSSYGHLLCCMQIQRGVRIAEIKMARAKEVCVPAI